MDEEAIAQLTASVKARGILQPIRVRAMADGYQIVMGSRRVEAAKRAGLESVPAVVAEIDDKDALAESIIENLQREDLDLVDRAHAIRALREVLGLQSWGAVAEVLGVTREHIHKLLNVTDLPQALQEDVQAAGLSEKHVRSLHRARKYPAIQTELFHVIVGEGLSGDKAWEKVQEMLPPGEPRRPRPVAAPKPAAESPPERPALEVALDGFMEALMVADDDSVLALRVRLTELRDQLSVIVMTSEEEA
jgi:ParB family chromosome partitioning protein